MASPMRWLKWQMRTVRMRPRLRAISRELSRTFDSPVQLRPVRLGGGQDDCFSVHSRGGCVGMLRVTSPMIADKDVAAGHPRIVLPASRRIDREWSCYQLLSKHGLAPKPLWRDDSALCCEHLPLPRLHTLTAAEVSRRLAAVALAFQSLRTMHDCGIVHLDATLRNMLVDEAAQSVRLIDFEYGPATGYSTAQLMAYDYLFFLKSCCASDPVMMESAGRDYWIESLRRIIPSNVQSQDIGFLDTMLTTSQRLPLLQEIAAALFTSSAANQVGVPASAGERSADLRRTA